MIVKNSVRGIPVYYIVLTAFALLISSIFLVDGIKVLKRKNEKYDSVATALVENIEITQRVQSPKVTTLFITYKYIVDGIEYHTRESMQNKNNADVGLHEKADELGVKLGVPIDSEITIYYQHKNPSRSVYDIEWRKYTNSLGSVTGIIFGGFITAVLLIVEILLIWSLLFVNN